MGNRRFNFISVFLALLIGIPVISSAEDAIGVVTALKGKVKLTRGARETDLGVKDGLFSRDVISTKAKSQVRILFGGKSTVTVRELSRLAIVGTLDSTGALRTIHQLNEGEILMNAPLQLSQTRDEIQIRTPNSLASIRGASLLTRCDSVPGTPLLRCRFVTLSGTAIITPVGRGPISLSSNASLEIQGTIPRSLQVGSPLQLPLGQVSKILRDQEMAVAVRKESNRKEIGRSQADQASQLSSAVVQAIAGTPPTTESKELAATLTAEPSKNFNLEDTIEGSRPVKQLDNPASLITAPSEGGTVLLLPTP